MNFVLFADDVMMLAEKCEDMERNLNELKKKMDKWDMKIHWEKTKVMMVSRNEGYCKVSIDGQVITVVEKLKYLGVQVEDVIMNLNRELEQHQV